MKHLLRGMLGVVTVLVLVVTVALAETKVNPKDGAMMVWIPEGKFLMGSKNTDAKAFSDEKPQHTVYLDGYWIYKTEVTVAQYKAYCAATGEQLPELPSFSKDDHPMANVTWSQARAYCEWAGGRLPSEAQWEKAARGTDGRKYPWGNAWDANKCNNRQTGPKKTMPVGSFPKGASPYGCLDMAGNVWEWCEDWYSDKFYKKTPARNPTGPDSGVGRVLRGGSWDDTGSGGTFRAADRASDYPHPWLYLYGFRCSQGRMARGVWGAVAPQTRAATWCHVPTRRPGSDRGAVCQSGGNIRFCIPPTDFGGQQSESGATAKAAGSRVASTGIESAVTGIEAALAGFLLYLSVTVLGL